MTKKNKIEEEQRQKRLTRDWYVICDLFEWLFLEYYVLRMMIYVNPHKEERNENSEIHSSKQPTGKQHEKFSSVSQ